MPRGVVGVLGVLAAVMVGCAAEDEQVFVPASWSPPTMVPASGPVGADWTTITWEGSTFVCQPGSYKGPGWPEETDLDCIAFVAGDQPPYATDLPDVRCTPRMAGVECLQGELGYYPSELDDLDVAEIEGRQAVCVPVATGSECWPWDGRGSPRLVAAYEPAVSCDVFGGCLPYGYELLELEGRPMLCIDMWVLHCWEWGPGDSVFAEPNDRPFEYSCFRDTGLCQTVDN